LDPRCPGWLLTPSKPGVAAGLDRDVQRLRCHAKDARHGPSSMSLTTSRPHRALVHVMGVGQPVGQSNRGRRTDRKRRRSEARKGADPIGEGMPFSGPDFDETTIGTVKSWITAEAPNTETQARNMPWLQVKLINGFVRPPRKGSRVPDAAHYQLVQFIESSLSGEPLGQAELSSRKTTERACQKDETDREAAAPIAAHRRPGGIRAHS